MGNIRIGVFGHYGNSNLGDESIIRATLQNLESRLPDADLLSFSINPESSEERYGIKSFPIRNLNGKDTKDHQLKWLGKIDHWTAYKLVDRPLRELGFLSKSFKYLKDLDLLLICGSNQFIDTFGGVRGYPYTLMKWTVLAKMRGVKVAYISVGAGPILNKGTYRLLKPALRLADFLSYRDQGSKQLIEEYIKGVKGGIYPDLAHGLTTQPELEKKDENELVVGINPMPVFDSRYWFKSDDEKYQKYLQELADFTKFLIECGHKVMLFNTHPKDVNVAKDILTCLDKKGIESYKRPQISVSNSVRELINVIASVDVVVATRFHASVLPLRLGKPVLGIGYYRKTEELLQDVGLGDYYVDINKFTAADLISKIKLMLDDVERLKSSVNVKFTEYKKQLDHQWDSVIKLVEKIPD